jgi:predicted nucleic acid-binding protein
MTDIRIKTDSEPEIDRQLVEEAQRHLGDLWPNQVINIALLELVEERRARRRRALGNLHRIADEGGLNWDAIEEADRAGSRWGVDGSRRQAVRRDLSVADLVVAATAIRLKLEVLHEDADFETVARFVPELRQRRISAGIR